MANQSLLNGQRYTRPLAKCVDVMKIRDWIPEEARRRVDIIAAWTIIKNHYCAALVGRGVCPIECFKCREMLVSMFGFEPDVRNPEATLTWRAKDRSAKRIEELIAAQKRDEEAEFPSQETNPDPLSSLFPKKNADNIFLEMGSDYL